MVRKKNRLGSKKVAVGKIRNLLDSVNRENWPRV